MNQQHKQKTASNPTPDLPNLDQTAEPDGQFPQDHLGRRTAGNETQEIVNREKRSKQADAGAAGGQDDEPDTKPAHPAGSKPTEQDAQARMTGEGDAVNPDDLQDRATGRERKQRGPREDARETEDKSGN